MAWPCAFSHQADGDKLVVWLVDEDAKRRAIQSGKVKGVVKANSAATFTDTTENVARFVAAAGDSLLNLNDPVRFERIETVVERPRGAGLLFPEEVERAMLGDKLGPRGVGKESLVPQSLGQDRLKDR